MAAFALDNEATHFLYKGSESFEARLHNTTSKLGFPNYSSVTLVGMVGSTIQTVGCEQLDEVAEIHNLGIFVIHLYSSHSASGIQF